MKTVLILGANGRFGQAATGAFAQAGWRVLAQMRRPPVAPLPAGVTALAVPLADTKALCAHAGAVDAVVHAVNPVYTRWNAEAMPALHHGMATAQALDALFMLPGNVYNYGAGMPALLTEDTPSQPDNAKGRLRVAMEEAMQAHVARGLRSVVRQLNQMSLKTLLVMHSGVCGIEKLSTSQNFSSDPKALWASLPRLNLRLLNQRSTAS